MPETRTITLKFKGDESDVKRAVSEIEKSVARLEKAKFSSTGTTGGAVRQASGLSGGANLGAVTGFDINSIRQQLDLVKNLTARQSQFALADYRNQTKIAQLEARNRIQSARLEATSIEAEKRREYQNFVRLEKEKSKAAQEESKSRTGGGFGGAIDSFVGNLGAIAVTKLASATIAGGKAILDYSANLEQARIGLTTIEGSAAKAEKQLKDLQDFAKSTPFEFSELVVADQKLEGVGIAAEKVIPILRDVGSALAAQGRVGDLPFAIKALGDIQAKGKLAGQEIIQLANAGIPAIRILAGALNKTNAEVLALSENGQISSDVFLKALHEYAQSNFGGALEAQSKTFYGAISNIKDALGQTSEVAFRPLFEKVSSVAIELSAEAGKNEIGFADVGAIIAKSIAKGFGEVIGDELDREINDIAKGKSHVFKLFNENVALGAAFQEGTFGKRGNFGDVFESTSNLLNKKTFTKDDIKDLETINFFGKFDDELKRLYGEIKANKDRLNEQLKVNPNLLGSGIGSIIGAVSAKPLKNGASELQAEAAAKEAVEIRKKLSEARRKAQLNALDSQLAVRSASIGARVDLTAGDREQTIRLQAQIQKASLKSQIAVQSDAFNEEIKLNSDNKLKVGQIQIEKNAAIYKLNAQQVVNEINTQKEIAAIRRESIEKQRQSNLELKGILLNQSKFSFDNKSFDVTRAIERGTTAAGVGFAKLREIAQASFSEISQLTNEQYALQLQDQTLTIEQRGNVVRQGYLEQQKLAEDNRRTLIEINDKQNVDLINRLTRYSQQASALYQSLGESFGAAQNAFFNPQTFGGATIKGLQSSLLRRPEQDDLSQKIQDAAAQKENARNARKNFPILGEQDPTTSKQSVAIKKIDDAFMSAVDAETKYQIELDKIRRSIPDNYFELERFAKLIGQGNVKAFDDAAKASLKYQQILQSADIDAQIAHIGDLLSIETDAVRKSDLVFQLAQTQREKERQSITQSASTIEQYQNSLEGLAERLQKLRSNDPNETTGVLYTAQQDILRQQTAIVTENIALEEKLAHAGENSADRYRNAWLKAISEVRDADIQAVESQIASQVKLADAGTFHVEQFRASVLSHLAETKSTTQALSDSVISAFDKIGAKSDKFLDKSVGKIPIIGDLVKNFARKGLTDLTHNLLDKFLPGASGLIGAPKTGNPQVDAINESNKYLESIDKKLGSATGFAGIGGVPSLGGTSQGTGGGILGTFSSLIKGIFRGGNPNAGGGNPNTGSIFGGSAGGGIFNFASQNGGAGASNGSVIQQLLGRASSAGSQGLTTSQSALSGLGGGTESGNFLSKIFGQKSIFGEGGFNNPKNAKIAGGLAAIASLAGGFISEKFGGSAAGRRIGGILSGAGTGAQIGALLGGPVGALIGGGIGAIVGFFKAGGQRKKDEQARTEYLHGAIGDLKQIDALVADVRALRVSPESALSQATQIGATARTNYLSNANTIKDNKTRRIALSAVSELDYNIGVKLSELRKAADFAGSAIDRKNRIIPEFASGGFMDAAFAKQFAAFKRRNGNLGGSFTGADTIPAMLAQGEMVLNPMQQRRIIEAARHDIFRDKGIPGYAAGGFITPTVSAPTVNAANGASPININITLEGDGLTDLKVKELSLDGLKTETGERVVAEVFNKANRNNKIK